MPLDVVIRAQWGDKVKGCLVDRLAASAELIARLAGGGSPGHALHAGGRLPTQLGKGLTTLDARDHDQRLERIPGSLVPLDSVMTEGRTQVGRGAAL